MGFLQERQIDNQLKTETDQHVHGTNQFFYIIQKHGH